MTKENQRPLPLILHSALITLHSKPLHVLSALTVLAAIIRFTRLSHPCLWYDESMVYWRICGSYRQLLDCLRTDGFVPLHYSLDWVISRVLRPTPVVLRLVPAISGTLMVPAVYFLARQMVGVGTALLAASFAACSAFLIFYSRDAKMYADCWLFVTLNMGCVLWWMRSRNSTAWLCWVASGCAACGLHAAGAVPVLVSLLLLLTQSKMHWKLAIVWLLGVVIIAAGPVGYYKMFNRWEDRVEEQGWQDSGLEWIGAYNYGRSGPELVRYLATSTVMGWEWPKDVDAEKIQPGRVRWPVRAAALLGVILAISCLPWRVWWDRRKLIESPLPAWRLSLWLCFWIVLPAYGFYCRSVNGFWSPADWLWVWQAMPAARFWPVALPLIVVGVAILSGRSILFRRSLVRGFQLLLIAAVVIGMCQIIAMVCGAMSLQASQAGKPWQSLWVPRYLGFISPALAVAVSALIMRLPFLYLRASVIVLLLGLNLLFIGRRILGSTEPPTDLMALDQLSAKGSNNHTLLWMNMKRGPISPGGGNLYSGPGEYYLDILGDVKTTPVEFKQSLRNRVRTHGWQFIPPWRTTVKPEVQQLIVWDETDAGEQENLSIPPPPWRLVGEQTFSSEDYWIWQDLKRYHRAIYSRP